MHPLVFTIFFLNSPASCSDHSSLRNKKQNKCSLTIVSLLVPAAVSPTSNFESEPFIIRMNFAFLLIANISAWSPSKISYEVFFSRSLYLYYLNISALHILNLLTVLSSFSGSYNAFILVFYTTYIRTFDWFYNYGNSSNLGSCSAGRCDGHTRYILFFSISLLCCVLYICFVTIVLCYVNFCILSPRFRGFRFSSTAFEAASHYLCCLHQVYLLSIYIIYPSWCSIFQPCYMCSL